MGAMRLWYLLERAVSWAGCCEGEIINIQRSTFKESSKWKRTAIWQLQINTLFTDCQPALQQTNCLRYKVSHNSGRGKFSKVNQDFMVPRRLRRRQAKYPRSGFRVGQPASNLLC
jgi:hypothetical protein